MPEKFNTYLMIFCYFVAFVMLAIPGDEEKWQNVIGKFFLVFLCMVVVLLGFVELLVRPFL